MARTGKNKSNRWLARQQRDPLVAQARRSGRRSRATFKLEEIDRRFGLIRQGYTVIDLGAAPGGWSVYAASRVGPEGQVIAVDCLEMKPVNGVRFVHGDFTTEDVMLTLERQVGERGVDVVLSDMAPNMTGVRSTDQARSLALCETALGFSRRVLRSGGGMLIKVFVGEGFDDFIREMRGCFGEVKAIKPESSRDRSREQYLLGRRFDRHA